MSLIRLMLHFSSKRYLPPAAFLFFGSIALILWHDQNNHKHDLVLRHTETAAEQVRIRVEGFMNARLASLEMLADRWVERDPPDFRRQRFLEFAESLFRHYSGFRGIHWIAPDGFVRWVYPEDISAVVGGKNVYEHPNPEYRTAFRTAQENLHITLTPCIELDQGGMGFDAFLPLLHKGALQGYLDGVFQVGHIMEVCLIREIFENFQIRIHEKDRLIYRHVKENRNDAPPDRFHIRRKIEFYDKIWQLDLEPNKVFYSSVSTGNLLILGFGLGLSVVLSVLLYLLLCRMEMYKESRDTALREISERKRVEETLRENEKKLEALLSELAAKNAEMESFVYTVSHDLKTPIVTIDGFVGALQEDFESLLPGEGRKYLKYMSDAAQKTESLINDLLNLSRIGRMTEQETEFPFADLVEEALDVLRPQIEARGIEIHVQENLPLIRGERKRLGQAMDNLMNNAVKYIGKDNPSPRIEVGIEERDAQRIFFVRDNGIGIEKRYFDKIFQIFERLPAARQAGEGTGMGLSIVKRIIEHHGGNIWLTSEPGKGTTFFFTLNQRRRSENES